MSIRHFAVTIIGVLIFPCVLMAQTYPAKPVRIVTSDPGGGSDMVARAIAPLMTTALGQPVIVDNRGGGVVPPEIVSRAAPDGHTLIYYGNTLWVTPLTQARVPYDAIRDFVPISLAVTSPNVLVVHPSLPVKSVKDLVALARNRPGELNYASAGVGSSNFLAAELFKSMAKVHIVSIPYKGLGAATIDVLGGQVLMMFSTATVAGTHIRSGRLRALAVSSAERSVAFPDLPTVASQGLPGYESALNSGLLAPSRTPDAIVRRLNQDTVRALGDAGVREKFQSIGVDVIASTPEQFASKIKSEIATIGKLLRDAGLRVE